MAVRPRIQRAFLAWLDESARRFKRRIILRRRTDRFIRFEFDVGGPFLHGWLNRHEIVIAVDDDETTWDLILNLEAFPERSDGGIICGLCTHDKRRVFASREELWCDHLFEPLLQWVNETLAPAVAIALLEYNGMTEAKLVMSSEDAAKATKIIALR